MTSDALKNLARHALPLAVSASLFSACQGEGGSEDTPSSAKDPETPASPPLEEATYEPRRLPPLGFYPSTDVEVVTVGGTVSCMGETRSPSGAKISYRFDWFSSDAPGGSFSPVTGPASATLGVGPSLAHRWLKCVVTATDEDGLSTVSEPSRLVAVANSAPLDFIPAVSAETVVVGDSLSCSPSTGDPDGDSVSYSFYWQASVAAAPGEVVPEEERWQAVVGFDDKPLLVGSGLVGRSLRCVADASDSLSRSQLGFSATVDVLNQVPAAFIAGVNSLTPKVGDTLLCAGESLDPDGGKVEHSFRWLSAAEGDLSFEPVATARSARLEVGDFAAHKRLRCEITAKDEHGGTTVSIPQGEIVVQNSPPQAFASHLSSEAAKVGDTLECRSLSKDVDGDELAYEYRWYQASAEDGEYEPVPGEIFKTLRVGPALSRSHLRCRSIVTDPFGATVQSSLSGTALVANTPPAFFLSDVSASTAKVGDATKRVVGLDLAFQEAVRHLG